MAQIIFTVIVVIIIAGYLLDRWLDYLNSTWWSNTLPAELKSIYDEEKYRKSQDYEKTKHRFSLVTETFSLVLMLIMLLFDGFALIDGWIRQFTVHPVVMALCFFGVIGLAADLLNTPFSAYSTFVIEERFGFNKTTVKTFILDKFKSWFLGALIGGGLLSLIVWIYMVTGSWFWLLAWGAVSIFSIAMTMLYSQLIVPLFNKQTPLEEGPLRQKIEEFCHRVNFRLNNIFVMDGSKRSSKGNAYFTGLGKKKRIVLFDTLIAEMDTEQSVAVLAHEIGHYKLKHTLAGLTISILTTGAMLFLLSLFLGYPVLSQALGAEKHSFHLAVMAFGLLYSPVSLFLGILGNLLSRKHEYAADRFAGENHLPVKLREALIRLSVNHLSNLRPHPVYVFFHYSHPTLLQRISALDRIQAG